MWNCLDFSYGKYSIKKLNVNSCGDKGVSIGENSKFYSNISNIENVNVGVASKDFSEAKFDKINIKNVDVCLSSYNKKQEFSGGYIEVNNLYCENYYKKNIIDKNSIIKINNKNYN